MSHTPGPWTMDGDGWCLQAETWENQRLIAAAPELLAACEEFVRKCDIGAARSKRSYAQMVEAIKKAKGE